MYIKSLLVFFLSLTIGSCAGIEKNAFRGYAISNLTIDEQTAYEELKTELKKNPAMLEEKCFKVPVEVNDKETSQKSHPNAS